jgi:hypothetical protein
VISRVFDQSSCPFQLRRLDSNRSSTIVSFTSYPARLAFLAVSVYSALTQKYQPEPVVVWLPLEEFTN